MDSSKPSPSAVPNMHVRCESWRDFVDHYANDIGRGGLFVATDEVPPMLSVLDLTLQLPEATEIVLRSRVVQQLASEVAAQQGRQAGIALELLEMDPERRRQISQLIDFARCQGATNDPNASFARTMLELSPSLPPAEVGYRLALLHGQLRRASVGGLPAVRPSAESGARRAFDPARDSSRPSTRPGARESRPSCPSTRSVAPDRRASVPPNPARASAPPSAASAGPPSQPPRPTDSLKLKLMLTEFAHKHYEAALRTTREMLEANPGDPQALRWQAMCNARLSLARKDGDSAAGHYEHVLVFDPDNREARDFIKHHRREKKLHALPFGRYFVKKK